MILVRSLGRFQSLVATELSWRLVCFSGVEDVGVEGPKPFGISDLQGGQTDRIAIGSGVIIPVLLTAVLFYPSAGRGSVHVGEPGTLPASADTDDDRRVIDALDELLGMRCLHRDPDLTLSRLAHRLRLPASSVSAAVNRVRGLNVSQFENEHRIAYAAKALADSDRSISEIMQAVGFRTKSNFNREFKRVTGESPMDYRRPRRST